MKKSLFHFSKAEGKARQEILELIKTAIGSNFKKKLILIDYTPKDQQGDYTVGCFLLAKVLKKSPVEVAEMLARQIKPFEIIKEVRPAGPYLNFFVDRQKFSQLVLAEIFKSKKNKYGQNKTGKGKKVMVEYFSPNTNKPLTVGHIRNICLGQAISRLLKFTDCKTIQATLYNDRGAAIAKAILGYQKWGDNQTPKSAALKPDHFVGSFYTKFYREEKDNPALEAEAKKVLQNWEAGDKEIVGVWQKLMGWVLEGFKQTLAKLETENFDEEYYESEYYQQGKEVVENGLKKGVFIKDENGVIFAPLQKYGIADKVVLRPDETSLYITQDLHLAYLKDKYSLDSSIYVVGSEQDLYFKQLFKILELLGFKNAKNYHHLSYGMIRLNSGKIKSREGLIKGTGADELIDELEGLAKAEIKKRHNELAEDEINQRAADIALGALKFYILSVNPQTTMIFDPQKSLSFVGRTGPYLQYVYARITSIFEKEKIKLSAKIDFSILSEEVEFELIKLLSKFPALISAAIKQYDPSLVANYLYDLAKSFSLFYEKLPVLKAQPEVKKARLLLINDVKTVLATGLELLGIPILEKM